MEDPVATINSFLPAYPSLTVREDNLIDLFPRGFYDSVYRKKEFSELQPRPDEKRIDDGKFHPQPQQIFSTRYASYHTLYDHQLIIHSMGVGKTALAIMTVEANLENGFVGGVIAVPSKKFFRTFITEILKITGTKYYPPKYNDMTKDELDRAILKQIRQVYKFITFEAFANEVEKIQEQGGDVQARLREEYSNRIIIVDEAHNLRIQPGKKDTSKVNAAMHLLTHSVINCKILLMTGTPMKDLWNELADLSNIILPLESQLPVGNAFDTEFTNDGLTIKNEEKLEIALRGKVSMLRTIPSDVKYTFVGGLIAGLRIFNVDACKMSPHQEKSYLEAYTLETGEKKEGFYLGSIQAVNFVFPDGSYGPEGFKKYTIPLGKKAAQIKKQGERAKRGTRVFDVEQITPELKAAITEGTNGDPQKMLLNLQKYSAKYAATIKNILNQAERKGGNTFIYNAFVEGSGLIVFSRILELFGYTRSMTGVETTKKKRYALLVSQTIDEQGKIVANVQKTVNDPQNAQGEYIQVVIGSRTAGESLSFYNVEEIAIHTPYWNYSPIEQAIARGIRYRSHEVIEKIYRQEGKEFMVKIHHYAAIPSDPEESIDVIMYLRSEDKDLKIKRGERFLKQISYDCGTNRLINMRGVDGSRGCEYLSCAYKCQGIDNFNVEMSVSEKDSLVDFSSANNFYSEAEELEIIAQVKNIYRSIFSLTLTELFEALRKYQPFVVLKALKRIIDQAIPLSNRYGFKTYLREHNDVYFLVDSMEKPTNALATYYTSHPAVQHFTDLDVLSEKLQFDRSKDFLDVIYQSAQKGAYNEVLNYWTRLPMVIKEQLLEGVIDADMKKVPINQEFRTWLLNLVQANVHHLKNGTVVSSFLEGVLMCRSPDGTWQDCSDEESVRKEIEEVKSEEKKSLEDNPYGYYAIVNEELVNQPDGWKLGFWIRDLEKAKAQQSVDKRRLITGEKCGTGNLTMAKLASMAFRFGIDIPNEKDKGKKPDELRRILQGERNIDINVAGLSEAEVRKLFRLFKATGRVLCNTLLQWFRDQELVILTTKTDMKKKS